MYVWTFNYVEIQGLYNLYDGFNARLLQGPGKKKRKGKRKKKKRKQDGGEPEIYGMVQNQEGNANPGFPPNEKQPDA